LNKKILASLLVIGVVAAVAGGSTFALFNDTETSEDNTFAAGELDLTVDWNETYNGEFEEYQPAANINGTPIFNLSDIKPGDEGHAQVSLNNEGNPAHVWMNATNTADLENGCTEPEADVDDSCGEGAEGELQDYLEFTIYNDSNENGEQDSGEEVLYNGTAADLQLENVYLGEFSSEETRYIGVSWNVPLETGNVIQSDSKVMDFSFYAEQSRHNDVDDGNVTDPEEPGGEDENLTTNYWQVDLAQGPVSENVSTNPYDERLERFQHGLSNETGAYTINEQGLRDGSQSECIVHSEDFDIDREDFEASVDFAVDNQSSCEDTEVTLASYESDQPGFNGGEDQVLFDNMTEELDPGNYTRTVELPEPVPATP
jgi:predicted ribosomally synthesized peptide with SipW-like signal peptide